MDADNSTLEQRLDEQRRLNAWLQSELDRQRKMNDELRKAVADLARTFQATLVETYRAGEDGNVEKIRELARANRAHWQDYLLKIIAAGERRRPAQQDRGTEAPHRGQETSGRP